jgi:hypothetical protein
MSIQEPTQKESTRHPSLRMAVLATALMTFAGGFATVSMAESPVGASVPAGQKATSRCANPERMGKMRERRIASMHRQLDTMGNRLQITASEQPVWNQYKAARMDMMPKEFKRPGPDMNAAERAKFRAERAEMMAKKLAVLSQATSDLRAALSPNQQQVLDEMARQHRHKHFGARGHKLGMQQGRGGIERPMGGPIQP